MSKITYTPAISEGIHCPNITIDAIEEAKIRKWVDLCDQEISGLGKVIIKDDGSLHVNSVYLLEQEVSPAETELDDDSVASLLFEARADEGEMVFWWHSHVNMNVFWSGTDLTTIKQFGKNGALLSAVYNKRGERKVSLYCQGQGFHPTIFKDNLDMKPTELLSSDDVDFCTAQFKAKVKETPAYVYTPKVYSRGKAKGNVDPYEGVTIATYTPELLEKYGATKNQLATGKAYYDKIVSKWWSLDYMDREEWIEAYYEWHDQIPKPAKYKAQHFICQYAEMADFFDWDYERLLEDLEEFEQAGSLV